MVLFSKSVIIHYQLPIVLSSVIQFFVYERGEKPHFEFSKLLMHTFYSIYLKYSGF